MNFKDRDNIILLYHQIFIRNINIEKLNIDYERLDTIYQDPKTFDKYKLIINDIMRASKLKSNIVATGDLLQRNVDQDEFTEKDINRAVSELDSNKPFLSNFSILKSIAISLEKKQTIEHKDLVKFNAVIHSMMIQTLYKNEPELEFILLRNLILLIVKFGIYNAAEHTGLIDLDFKYLLSLANNAKNNQGHYNYSFITDSRLEIIYLLLKNKYNLFKQNYQLLFKFLRNKRQDNKKLIPHQSVLLKIKWLKLITNIIIENKTFISLKFFERKLLGNFIKLIPDIEIDINSSFIKELINSVRLLLENFPSTLEHIAEKEYLLKLNSLLEVSCLSEGAENDDKLNLNLLKLLIIVGLDLKKYPKRRVITLFEKEHLFKIKTPNNLSSDYKSLIIKTVFYLHNVHRVECFDNDPMIKAYNNIEDKSILDECPTPIIYNFESAVQIKDHIHISTHDIGKINSVYLKNLADIGFKEQNITDNEETDSSQIKVFVTEAPSFNDEYDTESNDFDTDDIDDDLDSLKIEFENFLSKKSFIRSPSSTSASSFLTSSKGSMKMDFTSKIKKKKFFGIKM